MSRIQALPVSSSSARDLVGVSTDGWVANAQASPLALDRLSARAAHADAATAILPTLTPVTIPEQAPGSVLRLRGGGDRWSLTKWGCGGGAICGALLGGLGAMVPLVVIGGLNIANAQPSAGAPRNTDQQKEGLIELVLGVLVAPWAGGLIGMAVGALLGGVIGSSGDGVRRCWA